MMNEKGRTKMPARNRLAHEAFVAPAGNDIDAIRDALGADGNGAKRVDDHHRPAARVEAAERAVHILDAHAASSVWAVATSKWSEATS